jgi:hypothetical protein
METTNQLMGVIVKADTKWLDAGGLKHRGIHDFKRIMSFERELFPNEMQAISKILAEEPGCPGYTGVTIRKAGEPEIEAVKLKDVNLNTTYICFTTYDSSG